MNMGHYTSESVQARCASVIHPLRRHRLACKCLTHRPALEPCFSGVFSAEKNRKRYARMYTSRQVPHLRSLCVPAGA